MLQVDLTVCEGDGLHLESDYNYSNRALLPACGVSLFAQLRFSRLSSGG